MEEDETQDEEDDEEEDVEDEEDDDEDEEQDTVPGDDDTPVSDPKASFDPLEDSFPGEMPSRAPISPLLLASS